MRYELSDNEWRAIRDTLPNKPRGVARVRSCCGYLAARYTAWRSIARSTSGWLGLFLTPQMSRTSEC
jgi:transposase